MKKTVTLLCLLVALLTPMCAQTLQVGEEIVSQKTKIQSIGDGISIDIPLDVLLQYDQQAELLSLTLVPHSTGGMYDGIWLPSQQVSDYNVKSHTRIIGRAKARRTSTFRRQAKMLGVLQPGVRVKGGTLESNPRLEYLPMDSAYTYFITVKDPTAPIEIQINNPVAYRTKVTYSGKRKYYYQYIGGNTSWDLILHVKPCLLKPNSTRLAWISDNQPHLDSLYREVADLAERPHRHNKCIDALKQARVEYDHAAEQLDIWKSAPATAECSAINEFLSHFESMKQGLNKLKCTKPTTIVPTTTADKRIKEATASIQACITKIRAGKDTALATREAESTIRKTEQYIESLRPAERTSPQVQTAIEGFNISKETFTKLSNR